MATKVNTKFVIGLSASLVVLFGVVAGFAYLHFSKRAERYVARADARMVQGEVSEAATLYARAVGLNRTRLDWLEKWREALVQLVPEEVEYSKQYEFYKGVLRLIALLKSSEFEPQQVYLAELQRFTAAGGNSRVGLEGLIDEAEGRAQRFADSSPESARLLRYRGLALVTMMERTTLDQLQRAQAQSDLRAAESTDAADWEARLGLLRWHLAESGRHRRSGDDRQRDAELDVGREVLDQFLIDFPLNAEGLLRDYAIRRTELFEGLDSIALRVAALPELQELARAVVSGMMAAPGEEIRADTVERAAILLISTAGGAVAPDLLPLADRALSIEPTNARLMLVRGMVLQEMKRFDDAIDQFQRIVDLPMPVMSLEGLVLPARKLTALSRQVDSTLTKWSDTSLTASERDDYLARATRYRDLLERETDASTRHLLLLRDAKLELARGNVDLAVRHLSDLLAQREGQAVEVKRLLARALEMQGNLGEALSIVQELAVARPDSLWNLYKLGELQRQLGDFESALEAFEACLALAPTDEDVIRRVAQLRVILGMVSDDRDSDEVLQAILKSRELRAEAREGEARELVLATMEAHPSDQRLPRELLRIMINSGDRAGALAIAEKACADNPSNTRMCQTAVLLANEDPDDPTVARIALINQEPTFSDLDKALERYFVYAQFDRMDEANAELELAAQIDPTDSRLIDYQFLGALAEKDFERARLITQRAADLDVDQAGGLKYLGRLQLMQGQLVEAVQTLESVTELLPFDPDVRRLLGRAYHASGRIGEAILSFQRAYEGRPDNPVNATEYARALMAASRGREALRVVEPRAGALRHRPNDPGLQELWLVLEAQFGNMDEVIRVRRDRRVRDQGSAENTVALANLLMGQDDWSGSMALVDEAEADGELEPSTVAMLRAEWHARQGDVDAGRDVIVAFNGSRGDAIDVNDFIVLGEYLMRHRQDEQGLAAFQEGREYQDPEKMEAERQLGDYYFSRGNRLDQEQRSEAAQNNPEWAQQLSDQRAESYELAAEHYNAVLASVSDGRVRRRVAETMIKLDRLDEAAALIDEEASKAPEDREVLGLRAALAVRQGNRRVARQHLDRAIELYPTDPSLFMQRAAINREDPALRDDALQDLEQVVRLRPGLTNGWIEQFKILMARSDDDEAFDVLRLGVRTNPDDDWLRLVLLRELQSAGPDREDELQAEVLRVAQEHGDDPRWLFLVGKSMAQFERWNEASEVLGKLFDLEPSPNVAREYLAASLRPGVNMPRRRVSEVLAEFETALDDAPEPAAKDMLEHELLLTRAHMALQDASAARRHLMTALDMIGEGGDNGFLFNQNLQLALGSVPAAVTFLSDLKARGELVNKFLRVAEITGRFQMGNPVSELLADATDLEHEAVATGADDRTLVELHRLIAQLSVMDQRNGQAADHYKQALELAPDDLQMNNDLAYILMESLQDPEAGLVYAQIAAELAPRVSPVIDTLGWAYYLLGQFENAERELLLAAQLSQEPESGIPAYAHLGLAQAALGKLEGARSSLRTADQYCRGRPEVCENFRSDLNSLREACQ